MAIIHLYRNFVIILVLDVVLLSISFFSAHLLRFDFNIQPIFFRLSLQFFPIVLLIKLSLFYIFDLYRGMWRFTSIADMFNVIKASTVATLLIVAIILFMTRFRGFSRSVYLIDWGLTIMLIGGFRLCVRFFYDYRARIETGGTLSIIDLLRPIRKKLPNAKNLLIIGAGTAGEKILREIRDNASLKYHTVGFLDDNPVKAGKKIHGVPVLGYINDLPTIRKSANAEEVLIAIPSANSTQMRRVVEKCKTIGIPFKTIPGYGELIDGNVTVNSIREVAYRDLIGREAVHLEEDRIGAYLKNGIVLVTGAGGSIGSELCRQIARFKPETIILYERAESPLYEIELELKRLHPEISYHPVLGDILDENLLRQTFKRLHPQTVFHAAAYKHVPMLELQPWRAVENNIIGTSRVIAASSEYAAERFVFVSTDKAVRPTNIMGASKRIAEMLVQCQRGQSNSKTRFMIVRFGNVFGSVGSVIPLFKNQIAQGGPVTVTHKDVTRFFMTIPEACQLILQAGAMGNGNEIYLLDMGTPIKIDDMAHDLIRLSGFEPDVDIKIEYIGLRPGEKLYEELITEGEGIVPTPHKKILVLEGTACDLIELKKNIHLLEEQAHCQDGDGIRKTLLQTLPDYQPQDVGIGKHKTPSAPPKSVV